MAFKSKDLKKTASAPRDGAGENERLHSEMGSTSRGAAPLSGGAAHAPWMRVRRAVALAVLSQHTVHAAGPASSPTAMLPLLILLAGLVAGSRATSTPSFRCYQCRVTKNEDCHEGYLKPCPANQAYDVCLTTVVKNEQQGFYIEKKCALGPCNLRDEKQSLGLGLDRCDRSKPSYSCYDCCKGDGCNTNGSGVTGPPLGLVPALLLALRYRRA